MWRLSALTFSVPAQTYEAVRLKISPRLFDEFMKDGNLSKYFTGFLTTRRLRTGFKAWHHLCCRDTFGRCVKTRPGLRKEMLGVHGSPGYLFQGVPSRISFNQDGQTQMVLL
jgi:hypothetical protein